MRLVIVSHVVHYEWEDALWAYGPYLLEIDEWAKLFTEVTIASPLKVGQPANDALPFQSNNIRISPIAEISAPDNHSLLKKTRNAMLAARQLMAVIKKADCVHVRCPGNLGLLGVLSVPLFGKRRIAKYAGQWPDYPGEGFSYRLQKWLLRSKWWNAPVTVYGNWPNQPSHVLPFFTSILSNGDISKAVLAAQNKQLHCPHRVLFVGRLSRPKNTHILIESLGRLKDIGFCFECRIVGEGAERKSLERQVSRLGLDSEVMFLGGIPYESVLNQYEWGDVLVLASETEGWPKALTEGMVFGLVCIGSNRGLVPQILAEGRGRLVEPGDVDDLTEKLKEVFESPDAFSRLSREAAAWAQQYSLDGLRAGIRDILIREWHLPMDSLRANGGEDR